MEWRWILDVVLAVNWRSLVDVFSAALTPVIGITTALIAYRQWKIDRIRLRHEQYERRATVFRGVLEHLSAIQRHAGVKLELLPEYVRATSEKEFLFDQALCDYLDEIYTRTVDAWRLDERNRTIPPGDPRKEEVVRQEAAQFLWLIDQIPQVRGHFSKYLRLE